MSMHADEDSDEVVVPAKRSNKEDLSSAEIVEGRASPKGNGGQPAAVRTLSREAASTGLAAVRQAAQQSNDALDVLHAGIYRRQVNWVLDADIQGFFDATAHSWITRFLEHRIANRRILRLVGKWLKVGIVEDGRVTRGERGAPQGAVISPILANVYLHYGASG